MPSKQLPRAPNLRLGWLEAFVAVAHHRGYEKAQSEVGINATGIRRGVLQLELWLRRVLVMDDCVPFEIAPEGERFLPHAIEILRSLEEIIKRDTDHTDRTLSLYKSKRSMIRLSDMRSLRAVADAGAYKNAVTDSGIEREVLQGDIKALNRVFGGKLIEGFSTLRVTDLGIKVLNAFKRIDVILTEFQAQLIEGYDFPRARLERAHHLVRQNVLINETMVWAAERGERKPSKGVDLQEAKSTVALQQKLLSILEEQLDLGSINPPGNITID